eukprot:Amastigsp_a15106_4.p4 type:complete len:197 gc:universal Amastigsp_a15106_4:131-721(+)
MSSTRSSCASTSRIGDSVSASSSDQTMSCPSRPPEMTHVPSTVNRTTLTQLRWPENVRTGSPVSSLHRRTVRSIEHDAISTSRGESAHPITESVCPLSSCTTAAVDAAHTRSVWSNDPVTSSASSDESATHETTERCPWNSPRHCRLATLCILTVLSAPAVTQIDGSKCDRAMARTPPSWQRSVRGNRYTSTAPKQ